jgi:hypothetical protein
LLNYQITKVILVFHLSDFQSTFMLFSVKFLRDFLSAVASSPPVHDQPLVAVRGSSVAVHKVCGLEFVRLSSPCV